MCVCVFNLTSPQGSAFLILLGVSLFPCCGRKYCQMPCLQDCLALLAELHSLVTCGGCKPRTGNNRDEACKVVSPSAVCF